MTHGIDISARDNGGFRRVFAAVLVLAAALPGLASTQADAFAPKTPAPAARPFVQRYYVAKPPYQLLQAVRDRRKTGRKFSLDEAELLFEYEEALAWDDGERFGTESAESRWRRMVEFAEGLGCYNDRKCLYLGPDVKIISFYFINGPSPYEEYEPGPPRENIPAYWPPAHEIPGYPRLDSSYDGGSLAETAWYRVRLSLDW